MRKKITLVKKDPQIEALKALKLDIPEGVTKIMELLPALVLNKEPLRPEFQTVLNAIVVTWILDGDIKPSKPLGRPSGKSEEKEIEACRLYWELRDRDITYDEATEIVAAEFHKNARQIGRYITKHKDKFKPTREERQREREWQEVMRSMYREGSDPLKLYREVLEQARLKDEQRDYYAEIDAIIDYELAKVTDIK